MKLVKFGKGNLKTANDMVGSDKSGVVAMKLDGGETTRSLAITS